MKSNQHQKYSLFSILAIYLLLLLVAPYNRIFAQDIKSDRFVLEKDITPTPSPFVSFMQTGFTDKNKPIRLFLSSHLIDYGPITPTNHIKRTLKISLEGPDSYLGADLFAFQNHPPQQNQNIIPDTTCDDGTCSQNWKSIWINPFTFGIGFSFDDNHYQQFADTSKNESWESIPPDTITIKLNVSQNQPLSENEHYEHTINFVAVSKL